MKKLSLLLVMLCALVGFQANAAYYIIGQAPFGAWNPGSQVEMTESDGVYTWTGTISGNVGFVFTTSNGSTWDAINAARYSPTSGNETLTVGTEYTLTKSTNTNACYYINGDGTEYTITIDTSTNKFKIAGAEVTVEESWTVAGSPAALFNGKSWSETATVNDMTYNENSGLWEWTNESYTITASTSVEFKIVKEHSWSVAYPSENRKETIAEAGTYKVVITFNADTHAITFTATKDGETEPVETTNTYTIAGQPAALFGTEWTVTDTNNDMTKQEDGTYTLTKSGVTLQQSTNTYLYKVAVNHSWDLNYGKDGVASGDNIAIEVPETAVYDVTFTFNEETHICTYTLTKQADVENVYTVAGTKNVMGSDWDVADTLNTLAKQVDGTYKLIKRSVTLYPADTCKFKVAVNHSWDLNYGQEGVQDGANYEFTAPAAAVYDVIFTYNDSTHICTWSLEKKGEIAVWILGTNTSWATNNGLKMNIVEDGVYSYTFTPADAGAGYGYFSFTKLLATTSDTAWSVINPYRFGPVSEGDFKMTDAMYGIHIDKAADGNAQAFEIPAGEEITVTVNLNENWIQIDKVAQPYALYVIKALEGEKWNLASGELMADTALSTDEQLILQLQGMSLADVDNGDGYFTFTTKLASNDSAWTEIDSYRLGPVSENVNFDADDYINTDFDPSNITSDTKYVSMQAAATFVQAPAGTYDLYVEFTPATSNIMPMSVDPTSASARLFIVNPNSTGVTEMPGDLRIASVKYYNLNGIETAEPTQRRQHPRDYLRQRHHQGCQSSQVGFRL